MSTMELMLEDKTYQFTKAIGDISGAIINCCTFQHNLDPYACQCGLKFAHKGQHKCYDKKCPFTWIDDRIPNPEVNSFQDSLEYCSASSVQSAIAMAKNDF